MRWPVATYAAVVILAGHAVASPPQKTNVPIAAGVDYAPVHFADLPGWQDDDPLAAFRAFMQSCPAVLRAAELPSSPQRQFQAACLAAREVAAKHVTRRAARAFFERNFTPHRVVHRGPPGLLTGYYEPVLDGSRTPTDRFKVPIYKHPPELAARATRADAERDTQPYFTRAEIEQGALVSAGLELFWVADEIELYFLQIEGSGRIRLPDGSLVRVSYAGKNGHPYTSIGRALIDQGIIDATRMSQKALASWLRADRARGLALMRENASYVFFRELPPESQSALGVMSIPLTPGRSLAVDTGFHPVGAPVYVSAPLLTHAIGGRGYHRLMIAQDIGAAIKGPERGDLYFGSGDRAGTLAGITRHEGRLFVLLPHRGAAGPAQPKRTQNSKTAKK